MAEGEGEQGGVTFRLEPGLEGRHPQAGIPAAEQARSSGHCPAAFHLFLTKEILLI